MIYNKIYDFCKVKNVGTCYENGDELTPRLKYIIGLIESLGIEYEIDVFKENEPASKSYKLDKSGKVISEEKSESNSKSTNEEEDLNKELKEIRSKIDYLRDKLFDIFDRSPDSIKIRSEINDKIRELSEEEFQIKRKLRKINGGFMSNWFSFDRENNYYFNIIMKGTSDKMIVAHHDIVNPNSDNANDNSCSVINAIATKMLKPDLNVCLLDGEEMGGKGSSRVSKLIKAGKFGSIKWVLNYELTGKGGKNFFIGDYPGPLFDLIRKKFDPPVVNTPFNDSVIFRQNGIDSCVINPLPPLNKSETEGSRNRRGYSIVTKEGLVLDHTLLSNCHSMSDSVSTISPKEMKEFVEEIVLEILK
jgi:hypothetical protein